ncbi:MAG TPA: alanine racemase [Candidatus Obscuribacter sp.]|mgnify:CR=1 FL=1|nr:alanine racemase [Candidatus Obscuribacter sp.]HND07542.1 alanine racemase [Candidatus Obscuribacter sp.]HNH73095.1 alanine racemase [Candidatus Obscuribacter sp.]
MHSPPHNLRHAPASVQRDAWVEISLTALEHNLKVIRGYLAAPGKTKRPLLMAVVKSDAYGHGAATVGELLEAAGADYLGVASIDEGCQLRSAGIKSPILILSPTPSWAIESALDNDLGIALTSHKQALDVAAAARKRLQSPALKKQAAQAQVHLKIDTGMHRLGVKPEEAPEILEFIHKEGALKLVSVFSHLAMADDRQAVEFQNARFAALVNTMPKEHDVLFHLASSEATRLFDFTHYDMVRVGLYLYGLAPTSVLPELKPALSVKARINHIGAVPQGESAGYSFTWTAARDSRLAMIPIGYADGVDRGLSNKMTAFLAGKPIQQVGRISMDQMLFDITDLPEAQEGDVVTLIGEENASQKTGSINLSQWAFLLDTITYELACRLRARLPRIYTRTRGK